MDDDGDWKTRRRQSLSARALHKTHAKSPGGRKRGLCLLFISFFSHPLCSAVTIAQRRWLLCGPTVRVRGRRASPERETGFPGGARIWLIIGAPLFPLPSPADGVLSTAPPPLELLVRASFAQSASSPPLPCDGVCAERLWRADGRLRPRSR